MYRAIITAISQSGLPDLKWLGYQLLVPDRITRRALVPVSDNLSIAVLPFTNLSDDPKKEVFCDGLTEEIINGLTKVPSLFVIARNSMFTYKGKPVKVQQVAEDLGVRYVLEGSIRKEGDRIRVTAQLIDATNGHHLFSERFDLELEGIFDLQDKITLATLKSLDMKLTWGEG